jgi:transcriptional regulator with XRE-family HTH domain
MATVLGEKLKAVREKKGWTQREVQRRTGIHNAHVSQIETGAIERPAPNILWTLAQVYELDFQELLRLAGHVEKSPHGAPGSVVGAALRALGDLSPEEQQQVLEYAERVKREQQGDRSAR